MRQSTLPNIAASAAQAFSRLLLTEGQTLPLYRKGTVGVGSAGDIETTVLTLPVPFAPYSPEQLRLEGRVNVENARPFQFAFLPGTDVQEGDHITLQTGDVYALTSVVPIDPEGTVVALVSIGVRV